MPYVFKSKVVEKKQKEEEKKQPETVPDQKKQIRRTVVKPRQIIKPRLSD